MANQEMERALIFAGYEVNHAWGEGGHDGKQATEVFPDAMRWLWKGYPEPVKAGAGSPQLKEIVLPGEGWELVADGYRFTEGPAANAKGEVFFNDIPANKAYKVGLDGKVSHFAGDTAGGNGQSFGLDGRLFVAASKSILSYDPDGKAKVFAEGVPGNDLVVRHDGGIFATAPGREGQVVFVNPEGKTKVVDSGLGYPNGVTLSPDQSLLYVADSRSHWVYSYQVQADGTLADKQKYYHLHTPDDADSSGADGLRVDRDGRLYVATRMGVQVCDQAGRVNCILPVPKGQVSNLCFGGENHDILYATCGDRVYRRKLKTKGVQAFEAPIKPAAPRL